MSARTNFPHKSRGSRQCACPRNRLDNLILDQEDAISILRIVQLVGTGQSISDQDCQIALRLTHAQARVMGWLIDRAIKDMTDPTPYPLT